MHQLAPTEFDDAVERYKLAEREFNAAAEALRLIILRRREASDALKVALALEPPTPGEIHQTDIGLIQKVVAEHYRLPAWHMKSQAKPNHIAQPRQLAMLLAREFTKHPLEAIGEAFSRHHGTVIHGCKAVIERTQVDGLYRAEVEEVRAIVRAALGIKVAA